MTPNAAHSNPLSTDWSFFNSTVLCNRVH